MPPLVFSILPQKLHQFRDYITLNHHGIFAYRAVLRRTRASLYMREPLRFRRGKLQFSKQTTAAPGGVVLRLLILYGQTGQEFFCHMDGDGAVGHSRDNLPQLLGADIAYGVNTGNLRFRTFASGDVAGIVQGDLPSE
jgi:hypothetical protein